LNVNWVLKFRREAAHLIPLENKKVVFQIKTKRSVRRAEGATLTFTFK